jgi:primosomal protein N' (replication factor Y)
MRNRSGKTDVYLAAAARALAQGRQVLMLVPEINLTPQLLARVRAASPGLRVGRLHSGLSRGERHAEWVAAASGAARLVLGTRLAVFAPLPMLGLVIVDEEQDASYKQQDNVRYHARDAAIWRAQRRTVPIVLGSARPRSNRGCTPASCTIGASILPQRADPRAALPPVILTGNRAARSLDGIGETLRSAIAARLARREQSLIFVNRRGFAPSLICSACKWEAHCPRCSARLTTHREPPSLRCHHADTVKRCLRPAHVRATSICCRSGTERSGFSARGRRVSHCPHRAGRSRQHAERERIRQRARARSRRIPSTSWSARKCWRMGHDFPR